MDLRQPGDHDRYIEHDHEVTHEDDREHRDTSGWKWAVTGRHRVKPGDTHTRRVVVRQRCRANSCRPASVRHAGRRPRQGLAGPGSRDVVTAALRRSCKNVAYAWASTSTSERPASWSAVMTPII